MFAFAIRRPHGTNTPNVGHKLLTTATLPPSFVFRVTYGFIAVLLTKTPTEVRDVSEKYAPAGATTRLEFSPLPSFCTEVRTHADALGCFFSQTVTAKKTSYSEFDGDAFTDKAARKVSDLL